MSRSTGISELMYKSVNEKGGVYKFALKCLLQDIDADYYSAQEYADFIEFLQNELGHYEYRELRRKFEIEQEYIELTYDENLELIER